MTQHQTIAVFGATGSQGRGVVDALKRDDTFRVRALTRHPDQYSGQADEAVGADLNGSVRELTEALRGAYGVFLVTNFWAPGTDEGAQASRAIEAAREASVQHFVWSTLPDIDAISGGRFNVPHFTNKARINVKVAEAGFKNVTFVEAPFYYQNLIGQMGPTDLGHGKKGWALPLAPSAKVVHMGDIQELGLAVRGAFQHPELVGDGKTLSVAGDCKSFDEIVATLNSQGHELGFEQVTAAAFAEFFPGAEEMGNMMQYWEEFTYFGPKADEKVALAQRVAGQEFTDFASWAAQHMPARGAEVGRRG